MTILPFIFNFLVFFVVALFHYYWAFGGKFGVTVVFPEFLSDTPKVVFPGKILTFVVASIFLGISSLYLFILFRIEPVYSFKTHILISLAVVLLIRAIGEFKYIGLFKKEKNTGFAKYDTAYYSPLCLLLSIISAICIFIN